MGKTHIEIDETTRDELRVFKAKEGITYDEAVALLLETVDLEEHRNLMANVASDLQADAKRKRDFAEEANDEQKARELRGIAEGYDIAAGRINKTLQHGKEEQDNG